MHANIPKKTKYVTLKTFKCDITKLYYSFKMNCTFIKIDKLLIVLRTVVYVCKTMMYLYDTMMCRGPAPVRGKQSDAS